MAYAKKKRPRKLAPTIDLSHHLATLIAVFANRMSRAASRYYRERFGIGIVEWRVLMFVGHAKETSANRICRGTDLDKGAVSRSLNVLAGMGIVRIAEDSADSRRRSVTLTSKGRALHDKIVPISLTRHQYLLTDLSPSEINSFMNMIGRMQARIHATPRKSGVRSSAPARRRRVKPARPDAASPMRRAQEQTA